MTAKPLKDWNVFKEGRLANGKAGTIGAQHCSAFQINLKDRQIYRQVNVERRGAVPDLDSEPDTFEIACDVYEDTPEYVKKAIIAILKEKIINDMYSASALLQEVSGGEINMKDIIAELNRYCESEALTVVEMGK